MVIPNPGRSHSIQFQILITTDRFSVNEYLTYNSNTSKENAPTKDSNKSSMLADNLLFTKPNHHHKKKENNNGNCVQNDANVSKARDEITQFTFRETALNTVPIIFSLTYEGILIWSSKSSCIECKGDLIG